jgi:hypothetical protein
MADVSLSLPPTEAVSLLSFARRLGERTRREATLPSRTAISSAITAYMEGRARATRSPMVLTGETIERALRSFYAGVGPVRERAMVGGGGQAALFIRVE